MHGGSSASPAQHRIATNSIELDYLEQGEGAPLLMLHGFPDHAASWRPLAERLGSGIHRDLVREHPGMAAGGAFVAAGLQPDDGKAHDG